MEPKFQQFDTDLETAAAAGENLNTLLAESINTPILLLLSGGSSLNLLDYVSPSVLGEHLTISMLDERFSQEKSLNNFLQLQQKEFCELALAKDCSFIGTLPRPGELPEDLRARWEIALKTWKTNYPEGKILATFGIGPDGHTAGIFPMPEEPEKFEAIFENNHWIAAYKANTAFAERVTATLSLFKLVDEAVVFACGRAKEQAIRRFLKGAEQPHQLPAVGIYETKKYCLFTDLKI